MMQAKRSKVRKRHAMVDTDGRALKLQAHSAAIQDRDGAGPLLRASRSRWPFVQLGFADGGYAGPRVANASPIRIQVVRKADKQVGFAVIARRWVVERFFAWINRDRRLAKDFEASTRRSPTGALPWVRAMFVLTDVSSRKIRRPVFRLDWPLRHSVRACATSARSCSAAWSVFFYASGRACKAGRASVHCSP
jgi:transposase